MLFLVSIISRIGRLKTMALDICHSSLQPISRYSKSNCTPMRTIQFLFHVVELVELPTYLTLLMVSYLPFSHYANKAVYIGTSRFIYVKNQLIKLSLWSKPGLGMKLDSSRNCITHVSLKENIRMFLIIFD